MRITDPVFVKAWLAASGIADMVKSTGLSYSAVKSRAMALRKRGIMLPHLQRGRRAYTPEENAHLNLIITTTLRDEISSAAPPPPPGAGLFYPLPPAPSRNPFLDAVIAWWIPARTGIELDVTELIGELGAMDKPPPRQYLAPWELGKSLRSIIADLVPRGIVVTSRVVSGKTLWKFEAGPIAGEAPLVSEVRP